MQPSVVPHLSCPVCAQGLALTGPSLRCGAGHTFDVARQGYVNLLAQGCALEGDTGEMLAARAEFLAAGHFAPLADALAALARERCPAEGLIVEVGAGTAYYLARLLDGLAGRWGLALDLSKHAARRAAKAHPRLGAAVADVKGRLPLADGSAALVLDVFAPRNASEFRRVLRADGVLLVVTPTSEHLAELRGPLGLLSVDPEKDRRLAETLEPCFRCEPARRLDWPLELRRSDVARLVGMGPSARHVEPERFEHALASLEEPVRVTARVSLMLCAPR